MPATAGSTSGSSIAVSTTARPRNRRRATIGGRRADEEDDRLRDEARLRCDNERVEDDAAPQLAQELARRHAEEAAAIGSRKNASVRHSARTSVT